MSCVTNSLRSKLRHPAFLRTCAGIPFRSFGSPLGKGRITQAIGSTVGHAARIASFFVVMTGIAVAQDFRSAAPHAILMDHGSGTVLYEKAADTLMIPASMAKVMTAELLFREIKEGRITFDTEFVVSENAWRRGGAPSGGSAMYAALGSSVKVIDLLQGLAIQSGNDASIVIAEGIAGNEANFARMMTDRARELGLSRSTFMNSTGLDDPDQRTTARDLAMLTAHIIRTYPDLYAYFGKPEFTWNKIRQLNRNPLIAMNIGADGVKTGYLKEAGYGLIGSAVGGGRRLIVVVNGLKTARERADDARRLLDWGFRSFETRRLFGANVEVGEASVYGGVESSVGLVSPNPIEVLIPRGSADKLVAKIVYTGPLMPPVAAGKEVARFKVTRGDVEVLDLPLVTARAVERGSISQRAFGAMFELSTGFIRDAFKKL
ncbi:D-alanyl-D-alanine carboxypeptidase [Hyphomicrobiales bacterium]|nr:D-alanyl-D-alanine carboxypeptidase [Hyphomicrobiales bacterium]CAH1663944.1 D-alanyl-D-alanine carboxypeptidase [Hyphomicrobiales bacterium]